MGIASLNPSYNDWVPAFGENGGDLANNSRLKRPPHSG